MGTHHPHGSPCLPSASLSLCTLPFFASPLLGLDHLPASDQQRWRLVSQALLQVPGHVNLMDHDHMGRTDYESRLPFLRVGVFKMLPDENTGNSLRFSPVISAHPCPHYSQMSSDIEIDLGSCLWC